jgi:hypothetical protein
MVTHGIPRRELETQYQMVLDKMVGSDLLDPDAVKGMLSNCQYATLDYRRKATSSPLARCSVLWTWGA